MQNDESKVLKFPEINKEEAIDVTPIPVEAAPQDEKIIVFQLVQTNQCIFLCLSADESNNKFDIGIIRR